MQPEIDLGPLTLKTFGIMFALGFLAAGAVIARRFEELGKPADWAYEMIFAALVGGLVGARALLPRPELGRRQDDLLGNLFSGSGLVWYGGAIGGAIAVVRLGVAARLPRARAARPRGDAARARLRDRPDRLPALRRRRLRQGVGPALGDVLSATARCRPTTGASDAGLRVARDGRWSPGCCGACATASRPGSCSRSTSCCRAWSASWSSSCAATTRSGPG